MNRVLDAARDATTPFGGMEGAQLLSMATDERSVSSQIRGGYPEPSCKLFLGNLDFDTDEATLRELLLPVSPVVSIEMGRHFRLPPSLS